MNLHRLDLNLLIALDALLTERSITRAAERLHLSASATSGALARLRKFFNDDLLTQIGRKMLPTPLGESLQIGVRDCLLHIQATVESRPHFEPANSTRRFSLMISDYVLSVLMPAVLQRLQREAPGVSVMLLTNQNVDFASAHSSASKDEVSVLITQEHPWSVLDRGEIDFLVMPEYFMCKEHASEPLLRDEYVCVMWTHNPLVGQHLNAEQFFSLGHVVTRAGPQRASILDGWFSEQFGRPRPIEIVTTNSNSVPLLLIGTHRIAIMQRRLADIYCKLLPLRLLPVPIAMPAVVEVVQWHRYRELDPGRLWLQDILQEAARDICGAPTPLPKAEPQLNLAE